MGSEKIISRIIPFTILLVAAYSVQGYTSFHIANTTIWWGVQALVIIVFLWGARYDYLDSGDKWGMRFVMWYLLWNSFSLIRGGFIAENYWDWKVEVGNIFALLMPIITYTATKKERVQAILSFFIKYTIPASVLFLPFLPMGAWGWYFFPISLLMLFFPVLNLRGRIVVLLITPVVIFGDLGARSHAIKYGLPVLLLTFYYFRTFPWLTKVMRAGRLIFVIAPFLLFFLAISGIFNVFNMQDYLKGDYVDTAKNAEGEVVQEDLTVDTRSAIYGEVLQSALKHNYWLIGRSPARGNDTKLYLDTFEQTGRKERLANEVGILNIFTWTGVVGIFFFFLIFYKASSVAINKSNNIFSKMIGLFIAFRWAYAWVEDYNYFNLNCYVIWIMIGLCFSTSFREMDNMEVKLWVRGIFDRRYYTAYRENGHDQVPNFNQLKV